MAAFALLTLLSSCKNKPEPIVETVIQVDTVEVLIHDDATTFIVVRHAETTGEGSNPGLSPEGQERAQNLTEILQNVDLHSIYSTDFNRTQETAQFTANDQGLTVVSYDPKDLNTLAEEILALNNESVLVVGHSDTVPTLLNILVGEENYTGLEEDAFGDLFIVHVYDTGDAEVTHLTF